MGVPARFVGAPLCAFSNTIQARPLLGFPTRIAQEVEELNGLEEAFLSKTAGAGNGLIEKACIDG
jgi:hypothetical protein